MSPNPYASYGPPRVAHESRSELAEFVGRLRRLGASQDEIASVIDGWDRFDDEWTPTYRARFVRSTDTELRAALADVRAEYELGTTSEEDAARAEVRRRQRAAVDAAPGVTGGTIPSVLEWVGDDPARAWAVREYETGPYGQGRKTLLAQVGTLADGWVDAADR